MIYTLRVDPPDDLGAFRQMARRLLAAGADPAYVGWTDGHEISLFPAEPPADAAMVTVPRAFVALAEAVACHREPRRWALLYQALWRMSRGERSLLDNPADPLVHELERMEKAVHHDRHRMTAFVRFRAFQDGPDEHFIAWHEPRHRILRQTANFFIDRFAAMRFSILTPDLTLHWDGQDARFTPGLSRQEALSDDAVESWWQCYYAATFNPARLNQRLMKSHLPAHFRRNLPEARIIADLVQEAGARTEKMIRNADGREANG